MSDPDERDRMRAVDRPAEEIAAGSDDTEAQAAAILADSDEREASRLDSGGTVEHRTEGGAVDR
jgi:hypothetical protein